MAREPSIPLFLWVATAALAHILWGGGADQVAAVLESKTTVARFAQAIRGHVKGQNAPVEISLWDETALEEMPSEPSNVGDSEKEAEPDTAEDEDLEALDEATPKDETRERPDEETPKQPTEVLPKPEKPKAEDKTEDAPEVITAQPLVPDRRIAVKQTVKDKNQENPDAEFLGEHANKVDEQEQARITSTDQHAPNPTPGESHAGPSDEEGTAVVTDLGQSEDAPGDPEEAPSEASEDGADKSAISKAPAPAGNMAERWGETAAATPQARPAPAEAPAAGQQPRAALAELEAAPNTLSSDNGAFSVPPEQEARAAQKARKAIARRRAKPSTLRPGSSQRNLGTLHNTPGGINPNLTQLTAQSIVGEEQLKRERIADGERRRSKHRGSFRAVGLERWRSSIENYVSAVKPGNQTALNTARSPFANYLNHIHNRLHPEFAHGFLSSLDRLPANHAMNRPEIKAHMEIILSAEDGRVVSLGITRASGSTAFDVGALESVQGASPFGSPPREIISPDGRVYLHWEFYRNPNYACSTYFARPYILRVAPIPAPTPTPPTRVTPEEHGRHDPNPGPNRHQDG